MTAQKTIKIIEDSVNEQVKRLFFDTKLYYIKKLKAVGCKIQDENNDNFSVQYFINVDDFDKLSSRGKEKVITNILKKLSHFFPAVSITKAEREIGFLSIHASEELKNSRIVYTLLEASLQTIDYHVEFDSKNKQPSDLLLTLSPYLGTRERELGYRVEVTNLSTLKFAQLFCDEFKKMTDMLVKALRLFSS